MANEILSGVAIPYTYSVNVVSTDKSTAFEALEFSRVTYH